MIQAGFFNNLTTMERTKEEVLRLAKIFYPPGTKYSTAGSHMSSFTYIVENSDGFFFNSESISDRKIVLHAEEGKGNLYFDGVWARIFNGSQVNELELELEEIRKIIRD